MAGRDVVPLAAERRAVSAVAELIDVRQYANMTPPARISTTMARPMRP
jgi:hypothetical protein